MDARKTGQAKFPEGFGVHRGERSQLGSIFEKDLQRSEEEEKGAIQASIDSLIEKVENISSLRERKKYLQEAYELLCQQGDYLKQQRIQGEKWVLQLKQQEEKLNIRFQQGQQVEKELKQRARQFYIEGEVIRSKAFVMSDHSVQISSEVQQLVEDGKKILAGELALEELSPRPLLGGFEQSFINDRCGLEEETPHSRIREELSIALQEAEQDYQRRVSDHIMRLSQEKIKHDEDTKRHEKAFCIYKKDLEKYKEECQRNREHYENYEKENEKYIKDSIKYKNCLSRYKEDLTKAASE